jgi:hypothetical protein
VGEECVAEQHAGGGAIGFDGGGAVPADDGAVHDVVVHERAHVDELDDGGGAYQVGGDFRAGLAPAEKHEGGADAFAGGVDAVVGHVPNLGLKLLHLCAQERIQRFHVRCELSKDSPEDEIGHGWRAASQSACAWQQQESPSCCQLSGSVYRGGNSKSALFLPEESTR